MKGKTLKTIALAFAVGVILAPVVRAADLVEVQVDGQTRQFLCDIKEETYEYIRVEIEGEEREIPVARNGERFVTTIKHGQSPPNFAKAEMARKNRQFQDAFELYKESFVSEAKNTAWLGPYIRFYAASAAFREAKYAQVKEEAKQEWYGRAADQWAKLMEDHPKHYFVPRGTVGQARALMRLDRFTEAREILEKVAGSDFPEWVKDEANVWEGRLLVEEGQLDEGISKLQRLSEELMDTDKDLAYLAMLSQGYGWLKKGKGYADRAEDIFDKVGLLSPDDELRAEAMNSRGLSLLNRGGPGNVREALLSFLRVVVLHHDIPHEHQRALYYAAKCSKDYYGPDTRFNELRKTLQTRYPKSEWTERVNKL